jgi:transmembrane protein 216
MFNGPIACDLVGMAILKFVNLEYTNDVLMEEAIVLCSICVLESIRIHLGKQGSLSDHGKTISMRPIHSIPHLNCSSFQDTKSG